MAAASTGRAAIDIGGTTVHTAFNINAMNRHQMTVEALQMYRNAFANVRIVFIDEVSMIGNKILHKINERLQNITMNFDEYFGSMDIIFCGDLRQLPPVRAKPIYEAPEGQPRSKLWESLKYYPLGKVC